MIDWQRQKHGLVRGFEQFWAGNCKLRNIAHQAVFGEAHAFGNAGRAARILIDGIPLRIQRRDIIEMKRWWLSVGQNLVQRLMRAGKWPVHFLHLAEHEVEEPARHWLEEIRD